MIIIGGLKHFNSPNLILSSDMDQYTNGKVTQTQEKHNTYDSQEIVSPCPAGDHKAARNRQYSTTETSMKHKQPKRIHKRSTTLERSVNKSLDGLISRLTVPTSHIILIRIET